jgi:glycerol-3-phosphate dehydrogenase
VGIGGSEAVSRLGGETPSAGLVRSHVVHASPESGLLTVRGKWTTYRVMGEEVVDVAVQTFGLGDKVKGGYGTEASRLVGSDG